MEQLQLLLNRIAALERRVTDLENQLGSVQAATIEIEAQTYGTSFGTTINGK